MLKRKNVFLLCLLFIAFVVRFKGVWFGYPLPVHFDEPKLVETALCMIQTGDLNPHFFNYPTLNIYLQAILYQTIRFFLTIFFGISSSEIPIIWYYIAGRTFNVLISVLTIFITYEIGRRLFSSLAGLFSAFFLTFSFLHVANSFLVTVDSSVVFWMSLSTLMAVLIYTEGKKTKYYLLCGIFAGLAISSKYTAFVCVTPLLVADYAQSRIDKDWMGKGIIVGLFAIPIAFLMTTPYAVLDFNTFMAHIKFEAGHYSSGHPGFESDVSTSFHLYLNYLISKGYGLFPTIFAVVGFIWILGKAPWKAAIITIAPVLLYILVGQYKVFFPRNIVAIVPFLSLLSGVFVFEVYEWFVKKTSTLPRSSRPVVSIGMNFVLTVVLLGSVWTQVFSILNHIKAINLPDTRWVSIEWIEKNIPHGSHVGREHYTPPLEEYTRNFKNSYLGLFAVAKKPKEVEKLDYMIVSSGDYGRYLRQPDRYPKESNAYREFFETNELVQEFDPDEKNLGGPKIRIYKILH